MLSNALARNKSADELASASATQMASQLDASIDVHTRVSSIDRAGKSVVSECGRFPYGRLILALGAEPVRLTLEGTAPRARSWHARAACNVIVAYRLTDTWPAATATSLPWVTALKSVDWYCLS